MGKKIKKSIAVFALLASIAMPAWSGNDVAYAKDTRPIMAEYKSSTGDKAVERLLEDTVKQIEINGMRFITFESTRLVDLGFDVFGVAKTHNYVRAGTDFMLFRPTVEGKSQFNGWILKNDEKIEAARANLVEFFQNLNLESVTDSSHAADGANNVKAYNRVNDYIWGHYPQLCREVMAYNKEHEPELKAMREEKLQAAEAAKEREFQRKLQAAFDSFAHNIPQALREYEAHPVAVEPRAGQYDWSMFVQEGAEHLDIDVNDLIDGTWYLFCHDYDFPKNDYSEVVRFVPHFFVDDQTGEIFDGILSVVTLFHEPADSYQKDYLNKEDMLMYIDPIDPMSPCFHNFIDECPNDITAAEHKIYMEHKPSDRRYRTMPASRVRARFRATNEPGEFYVEVYDTTYAPEDDPHRYTFMFTKRLNKIEPASN